MKLLATVDGTPLVQRTVLSLLDAGVVQVVLVVAPGHHLHGVPILGDPRVLLVTNPEPDRGMFSSVQEGLRVVEGDVILVLPGDMPFVPAAIVAAVDSTCAVTDVVVVPSYRGKRGHPVAIPSRLKSRLLGAAPASSLKEALIAAWGSPLHEIAVETPGVLKDVDVPADLHQ